MTHEGGLTPSGIASSREIGRKTSRKRKVCLFARQMFTELRDVAACSQPRKMHSSKQGRRAPGRPAVSTPGREDKRYIRHSNKQMRESASGQRPGLREPGGGSQM